jgi:hypothetical protein
MSRNLICLNITNLDDISKPVTYFLQKLKHELINIMYKDYDNVRLKYLWNFLKTYKDKYVNNLFLSSILKKTEPEDKIIKEALFEAFIHAQKPTGIIEYLEEFSIMILQNSTGMWNYMNIIRYEDQHLTNDGKIQYAIHKGKLGISEDKSRPIDILKRGLR